MDKNKQIELEGKLSKLLSGKLGVLDRPDQREEIVSAAIADLAKLEVNGRFKKEIEELANEEVKKKFIKEFLSYGIIQEFMKDLEVEDVIINSIKPIYIHHSQKGFVCTGKQFESIRALDLFIQKLVMLSGRINIEPIMNIELPNLEGRVNMIRSPFGPQLTITKAKVTPLSILDLIKRGTMSYEVAAQLWLYFEGMSIRPANIVIAGGPGVGKTTLLNALFSFIPEGDRIVVIEDTLELNTEFEDSCSRLESGGEFSLADLVKNSLRMRPERVIIGEVRGAEARDMMTAANIGKYCIGTIHALTSREAIIRMQNEPMNIPEDLIRLIDVFVVMKRYYVDKVTFRVIDEISETSGMEQEKILLAQIYKYDYELKTLRSISASTVYRDRLAQQAGLLPKDIILEVQLRAFLLEKLFERGHTTLREVTLFCRAYSRDPDEAVSRFGFNRSALLGKE